MTPWLNIIGIGEDGAAGLSAEALSLIETAEMIIGGDRHHKLTPNTTAKRLKWPSPFDAMIDEITAHKGRRLVILVTGDPLWYSVGARILRAIPAQEIRFHPQLSAFQWAAARMGWSLADCATLTVHGRPAEQAIPYFAPCARLLLLTKGAETPGDIAELLTANGYGASRLTVLGALGGDNETRIDGTARDWNADSPAFHTLAVECHADEDADLTPRWGLPDDAFAHDGKMTKQDVRAATIAKLWPRRGALLWDIGAGCGSVAVEWMRAARDARAVGLEPNAERRSFARINARKLGAPRLELIDATAPEGLSGLPTPDAVFIGGGLTDETAYAALAALPRHGRLVANAVTLESEALLITLHKHLGGELTKIAVSRAAPVGPFRGWKPFMPVTQWSITK